MTLTIHCDCCGEELTEPGALVFSPPRRVSLEGGIRTTMAAKFHVCEICWVSDLQHIVMP